ncbi:hypothetical protein BT69DRAFT_1328198 [Atractiella rhizophila]|nr:hypothetical protein BT69DRAFT_1328198 [Atractiella rhizophila]
MSKDFSTLLRHSRFATWDPVIEQVYTSPIHGGYRVRMDYGVKRSLPRLAKRFPMIRIQSIDTTEKYTEFDKTLNAANWLNRFEASRTGVPMRIPSTSSLGNNSVPEAELHEVEEVQKLFRLFNEEKELPPNFVAMSDREFHAFVDGLRGARGAWSKFLAARDWVKNHAGKAKHKRDLTELGLAKKLEEVKLRLEGKLNIDWNFEELEEAKNLEQEKKKKNNEEKKEIEQKQIELVKDALQKQKEEIESRLAALQSSPFELPPADPTPVDLYSQAQAHLSLSKDRMSSPARVKLLLEFFVFLSHMGPSSSPAPPEETSNIRSTFDVPPTNTDFLHSRSKSQPAITYYPHESFGLSYLPDNAFHRQHLAPTLPGRMLNDLGMEEKDANYLSPDNFFQRRSVLKSADVSVMGQITTLNPHEAHKKDIRKTQYFESDTEGKDMDRGRLKLRISKVDISEKGMTPSLKSANQYGAGLGGELGDKWSDGWRSRKWLLEQKPNVSLQVEIAKESDGLGEKARMGGMDWIAPKAESLDKGVEEAVRRAQARRASNMINRREYDAKFETSNQPSDDILRALLGEIGASPTKKE